jgi:hypothetical protein
MKPVEIISLTEESLVSEAPEEVIPSLSEVEEERRELTIQMQVS